MLNIYIYIYSLMKKYKNIMIKLFQILYILLVLLKYI